jgi:hypothetical protein
VAVETPESNPPSQASPTRAESGGAAAGGTTTEGSAFGRRFKGIITFDRMEVVSLFHSVVYTSLLICAFILGGPEPITFVLGLAHGILWIGMSITSLFALRFGVINLRLAVAITILGCIAPFFGTFEFIRQNRQRARLEV